MSHAHDTSFDAAQVAVTADTGAFQVTATARDATRAEAKARGEMDLATAEVLAAVLHSQLDCGRRFVRLDLSELTFLDCAGLGALVDVRNNFLAARGTLTLTGVGAHVARLLRITHLDEALFIDNSEDAGPSHRRGRHLSAITDQ
jgi:anti-sigma B factor antagonist